MAKSNSLPLETGGNSNSAEFSVSELAGAIKRAIEDGFGYVRLRGEISGFRGPHSSGHCYFSLKDERAKIDAVVWRGVYSKLKTKPEEGMEVIAQGRVTTYPNSSKYQIVVEALEPAGIGALMALLEERKRKFAAEGLFDEAAKQPLPFLPRVVGIITSPTGAVIRDMLAGFNERFPAHVIVWPVRVQGETSAAEVAAAIRGFNAMAPGGRVPRPDILIVARGGGSLEDLWSFNEEAVVRAAAESAIPLISAVGHETDWTLVDLVADARAPTPTKAAEWAVPKFADLLAQNDDLGQRLKHGARRRLESARSHLLAASRGLPRLEDLLALPRQRFDSLERRLGPALLANTRAHAMRFTRTNVRLTPALLGARLERGRDAIERAGRHLQDALRQIAAGRRAALTRIGAGLRPELMRLRFAGARERLDAANARLGRSFTVRTGRHRATLDTQAKLLATLGYQSVLKRGYALVRDANGRMLRAAAQVEAGAPITVEFHDGARQARVDGSDAAVPGGGGRTAKTTSGQSARPPAADASPSSASTGQPARSHPEPTKTRSKPRIKPSERDKQGSLF
ncbi:MAG: exodeoxyribonuclease VII large subunit [Hyphomicrobiaceae bacterium]